MTVAMLSLEDLAARGFFGDPVTGHDARPPCGQARLHGSRCVALDGMPAEGQAAHVYSVPGAGAAVTCHTTTSSSPFGHPYRCGYGWRVVIIRC